MLTRGLIKKKDEEILQDCFARCCMGELRRAAQTDALTGLWNVGGGKEHIQKILAGQKEEEINGNAMFLMDVDNFKSVNDTMGHMVGDETLKQLAQVLKNSLKKRMLYSGWAEMNLLHSFGIWKIRMKKLHRLCAV